jgi:hypothetical protein
MSAPDFSVLRGRKIYADVDGLRLGRCVSVDAGPRKGLRSLRLAGPSYEGRTADGRNRDTWNGRQYSVDARSLHGRGAGVLFRGRVVPIDEFLRSGGAR